ncbi:MAG: phage tail tape measure protein [Tenuifilaceae bacterium]|nr:phage tail tape measure protein [Tenuifilaceae bacterium]
MIGAATNHTMGFTIALKNQFSREAGIIKGELKGLSKENQMFTQNLQNARNLYGGLALASGGVLRGLSGWVREGAQFEYVMKGVQAVSRATSEEYDKLTSLADSLGQKTMFMPEDIASGMRYMAMAGQDAQTVLRTISAATNLAGATMTELGGKMGAADIMTNVLKGFQLGSDHSERIADVLATATTHANTSLVDLGNALKYVAATSVDLGVGVESTTALAMALGNAGIQGSMAGTALENMYRYLAMGLSEFRTNRQSKAWEALGLSPEDAMDAYGNLLPIEEVLTKIGENLKGRGTIGIQGILKEIFGVRGKRAGSAVIRMMDDFKEFQNILKNKSAGSAEEIMGGMMDSVQGDILKLISTFKSIKIAYTAALAPVLRPILVGLKGILQGLQIILQNPMGKFFAVVASGSVIFVFLAAAVRGVVAALGLMWRTGLGSFGAMNASIKLAWQGMLGLTAATQKLGAMQFATAMGTMGPLTRVARPSMVGGSMLFTPQYRTQRGLSNYGMQPTPQKYPTFFGGIGKMTGFLGKALGFLGPIGLGVSIFLPMLKPILGMITASRDETKRLAGILANKNKEKISAIFSNEELMVQFGNLTANEIVSLFKELKAGMEQLYGIAKSLKIIENKDPLELLATFGPLINWSKGTRDTYHQVLNSSE